MSELDDDIARGCLPNGEPIEARWGTGPWSEIPDQQQEPDPWEYALEQARQEGYRAAYLKALDDVLLKSANNPPVSMLVLRWVDELKREYEKGTGNDGKTNK